MSRSHVIILAAAAALTPSMFLIPAVGTAAPGPVIQYQGNVTIDDTGRIISRTGESVIEGSGRLISQRRPVSQFDRIELTGLGDVEVRLGSAPSLVITADDNLLQFLTSEVEGGTLKLGSRGSFQTRHTPQVRITVPDLQSLETSGSGDVTLLGVANRQLALTSSGSGHVYVAGRTGHLDATVQGSGNVYLRKSNAGNVKVSVLGSGNAWVTSSGTVRASSLGSGNVFVHGRPTSLDVEQGGSGRVFKRGS